MLSSNKKICLPSGEKMVVRPNRLHSVSSRLPWTNAYYRSVWPSENALVCVESSDRKSIYTMMKMKEANREMVSKAGLTSD